MGIEECKVFDKDGKLKEIISKEKCSEHFWENDIVFGTVSARAKNAEKAFQHHEQQNYVCLKCNDLFKAKEPRTYCHTPCTDPAEKLVKFKKEHHLIYCKLCEKAFMPINTRQIYCNNPCISRSKRRYDLLKKSIKCRLCKKVFTTIGKEKYCNKPCNRYLAYKTKHIKERRIKDSPRGTVPWDEPYERRKLGDDHGRKIT
jgi:hypothetical protein